MELHSPCHERVRFLCIEITRFMFLPFSLLIFYSERMCFRLTRWLKRQETRQLLTTTPCSYVVGKASLCFSFLFKVSMGFLRARLRDWRLMNFDSCVASLSCLGSVISMSLSRQHYRIGKPLPRYANSHFNSFRLADAARSIHSRARSSVDSLK